MVRRLLLLPLVLLAACASGGSSSMSLRDYHGPHGRPDELAGGVRMIPIETPKGTFRVWTRRVGNNPKLKVLLLHGGPGMTHEYMEVMDSWLPGAGVEYYHYDQLGSFRSDQPDEPELWEIPRFVEEVEQVRKALGLGKDDFVLFGHSWGGTLAIEYALAYPQHLKGLVISDMMASIPKYNEYARNVLMPTMDQAALKEIQDMEAAHDVANPRYMELLMGEHYLKHILRMPLDQWPDGVMRTMAHVNHDIYVTMQGPSELGASGKLEHWDRTKDLARIAVPTLVIGGAHDTMDPAHLRWMAEQMPNGRFHLCPNGSHLCMYDDMESYFGGLLGFLRELDR